MGQSYEAISFKLSLHTYCYSAIFPAYGSYRVNSFSVGITRSTLNDFNPRRSFSESSTIVRQFIKAEEKVATFEKFSSQIITFSIRTGLFFLSSVASTEL